MRMSEQQIREHALKTGVPCALDDRQPASLPKAEAQHPDEIEPADAFAGAEKQLSAMVVTDLRRRGVVISVPRGDRESTVQKGWPDLTCLFQGRGCCIELKVAGGKLSDYQRQCHAELRTAGVPLTVAWNFDAAIDFAKEALKL